MPAFLCLLLTFSLLAAALLFGAPCLPQHPVIMGSPNGAWVEKWAEGEHTPGKNVGPDVGLASGEGPASSSPDPRSHRLGKTAVFLCSKGLEGKCVHVEHSNFTYRNVAKRNDQKCRQGCMPKMFVSSICNC